MPCVDMPLDELKKYMGVNPRPADFDEFWDKSLEEMQATDPQVELVPAKFQVPGVECFDLWFTGVGGARIYAQYLRPAKVTEPCPAVLLFHGLSGSSDDWSTKLGYVDQGFCCAFMDCRGQGGQSEDVGGIKGMTYQGHIVRGLNDSPEKLLFRNIYLDTAQLARVVMGFAEVDETRVGAKGGSQGGGLTLACAALVPEIKRASSVYPYLCDFKRVWDTDLSKWAYDDMRYFFRCVDPTHEREEEFFTRLGYIDVQHLAPRIKADVLMFTGLMDDVCPPSTQFAAYNKITAPKEMVIYPDFGHENLPGVEDKTLLFMLSM